MSHAPEPLIDAVVVSYNSRDTLRDCVEPLAALPRVAVTVVDNASPDDSLELVADLPVRAIQSGRNAGFGAGCNLGMGAGSAPLVLFLNPDARIDAAAVERLVAVLDAEPDVSLVGPRILEDGGQLVPSMRRYQRASSAWAQALFLHRLLPRAVWANEIDRAPDAYDRVGYPEWVSGAAMLARRPALEAIGGFDEEFFLYCEDMDLCARLTAAGGRIRYEPGATVHHIGGHSAPRTGLLPVLIRSRIRFAGKHGGRVGRLLQHAALVTEAITHTLTGVRRPALARGHAAALRAGLSRKPA